MTLQQTKNIIQILTGKGIYFDSGLTNDEVSKVEIKFDFKFPPDLKLFLQTGLPISENFVNWRFGLKSKDEANKINSRLEWPLEGMLFDIRFNEYWGESWEEKPIKYQKKVLIAKRHYKTYPKLIPIYSHRYVPSRPNESGNPIFSIYQMDIIYYGYDLATYFANEFHFELPDNFELLEQPKVKIEFWSECAEY